MSLTSIAGTRLAYFYGGTSVLGFSDVNQSYTSPTGIGSTADRHAAIGSVVWADGLKHNIAKVHWNSFNNGFVGTFRLSLQGVTSSGTNPQTPNGTADQSFSSSVAPDGYTVTALSTARQNVAHGDRLSVVLEATAYTSGSFAMKYMVSATGTGNSSDWFTSSNNSGSTWGAINSSHPVIVFESDDATPVYGTLGLCWVASNTSNGNNHTYNSGSNPKVHALAFTPTVDIRVIGAAFQLISSSAAADFDFKIYNSAGTVLLSHSFDSNGLSSATNRKLHLFFKAGDNVSDAALPYVDLPAGSLYYAGIAPTTTTNVGIHSWDYNAVGVMDLLQGAGREAAYATLSSGGTWNAITTTRRPSIVLACSHIDTGGGGGLAQVFGGVR